MSAPTLIPAGRAMKTGDWLFPEDGTEALRDTCGARVLEDEVFYHFGELPQRMQAAFMAALRGPDTEANDREAGRILRVAFKRAVDEAVQMRIDRMRAEVDIFSEK